MAVGSIAAAILFLTLKTGEMIIQDVPTMDKCVELRTELQRVIVDKGSATCLVDDETNRAVVKTLERLNQNRIR